MSWKAAALLVLGLLGATAAATRLLAAAGETPLHSGSAGAGDRYGLAVAISGDTAAVVSPFEESPAGHFAYVFTRSGANWPRSQTLDLAPSFIYGYDAPLALSGNVLAVGTGVAFGGGGNTRGAVRVFERPNATSPFGAPLDVSTNDGALSDGFGSELALSEDASTLVVGASGAGAGAPYLPGAAYVFVRTALGWQQFAKLTAGDGAPFDSFGSSVAIAGDGNPAHAAILVVGAKNRGSNGGAYVFELQGSPGVWTQVKVLDDVGSVVGVTLDPADPAKAIIVVGDKYHSEAGSASCGAVRTFAGSGANWSEDPALLKAPSAQPGDLFGAAVSIAGDTLVVGAPHDFDSAAGDRDGEVFVAKRSNGAWSVPTRIVASVPTPAPNGNSFGRSVAVSGTNVAVGAGNEDRPNTPGEAFVYDLTGAGGGGAGGPDFVRQPAPNRNPAPQGAPVGFVAIAINSPAKAAGKIAYEWHFGDGVTQDAKGAVTHKYAAPGNYDAFVRATDELGRSSDSDPRRIVIVGAGTPYFDVAKATVGLKFKASGKDRITVAGQLPLADGTPLAGRTLSIDFGGVAVPFTLDAKGRSPKGPATASVSAPKGGVAKFTVKLTGAYAAMLADEGMTNATVANVEATTHVAVTFDGTPFAEDYVLFYAGKAGKSGSAK